MDIDIVGYFTSMLKTLEEREAPEGIINAVKKVLKNKKKFDPLRGSSKFIADRAFDEILEKRDPKW